MILLTVRQFVPKDGRTIGKEGEFDRAWFRLSNEETNQTLDYCMINKMELPEEYQELIPNEDEEEAPPFLEEALTTALSELVAERGASGKPKRRSRKRRLGGEDGNGGKKKSANRGHSRVPGDFDQMFNKLVEYKNEHGDCMVQKSYSDKKVSLLFCCVCAVGRVMYVLCTSCVPLSPTTNTSGDTPLHYYTQ